MVVSCPRGPRRGLQPVRCFQFNNQVEYANCGLVHLRSDS